MTRESNETSQAGRDWPDSTNEIRAFLETWYFSISVLGYMIVEAQKDQVSISDLRIFLRRLDLVWTEEFPKLVLFEFNRASFSELSDKSCLEEIRRFAEMRNAMALELNGREDQLRLLMVRPQ